MGILNYATVAQLVASAAAGRMADLGKILRSIIDGDLETPVVVTAASVTLGRENRGRITRLARAAGIAVTLPAATGSGDRYEIYVGTTVTSNTSTIKVANATDIMAGMAVQSLDGGNTVQAWETAADSDTVTMDGSTRGGIKGDRITLIDVASGEWSVQAVLAGTGSEATPFSATVS